MSEWGEIFHVVKLLLWVITGFEAICVYLIGLDRLHGWAQFWGGEAKSYRLWRHERMQYRKEVARHSNVVSHHYDQLTQKSDEQTANELRQIGIELPQEEERASEQDRLDAQSMGLGGNSPHNPHYERAQSLASRRRKIAADLGAPEPEFPKAPTLPILAFMEFAFIAAAWISAAAWLISWHREHGPLVLLNPAEPPPFIVRLLSPVLSLLLTILVTALLGAVGVAITKLASRMIALFLSAASHAAGWSMRKPVLHLVFVAGFVVAFALETIEQSPKVACLGQLLLDRTYAHSFETCINQPRP